MQLRITTSTHERLRIEKDARQDALEMHRTQIMKKGEIIRSIRQSHLERREAEEEEKCLRAKETHDLRNRQIERTYKLAKELSRLKNLETQKLIELRRSKRAEQFSPSRSHENECSRLLQDKIHREAEANEILQKCYADKSIREMQQAKAEEEKLRYRADLQNQIIEKRRILRELDEEKQRERKILEEMAEVLHEEDFREEMRKKETTMRLQAEKDAFFEARRKWKEICKATISEENKKINDVLAERETAYKQQMKGKSDIRKAREATSEKIARKMLDDEIRMTEREDICKELFLEKKYDEQIQKSIRLLLEKKQRTEEVQNDIIRHKIADTERKQKQRALDEDFTRYLYKEWQRLEDLDKQKIQKQREKNKQYGEELRNTITNNRIEYAMQLLKKRSEIKDLCEERKPGHRTSPIS